MLTLHPTFSKDSFNFSAYSLLIPDFKIFGELSTVSLA